jgi:hypothetical protein
LDGERSAKTVLALAILGSVGLVLALLSAPYLATNDGPQHIFFGYLENHFDDAARSYDVFLARGQPVTSLGFTLLFATLELAMSWQSALSLAQIIMALVWAWGFMTFCRAIHPGRAAIGLLGFACALQWPLYMGLFSFFLGTGFGFWTLALAVGQRQWTLRHRVYLAVLLFLQGIMHLFTAQAVGLVLIFIVAFRHEKGRKLRELGALFLIGVPVLLLTFATASNESLVTQLEPEQWLAWSDRIRLLAAAVVTGPAWRSWPLVFVALSGLTVLLLRSLRSDAALPSLGIEPSEPVRGDERGLASAAALLLVLGLTLPLHVKGWEFFSPRFLPIGLMLGAACVPLERMSRRAHDRWLVAVTAFGTAAIFWAWDFHRDLYERAKPALAGLDAPLERSGPRLAIVLDPWIGQPRSKDWTSADVPFLTPLQNLGKLYAVAQGGIPSWFFASRPSLHPFVFSPDGRRRYPPVHDAIGILSPEILNDPNARGQLMSFLASHGSRFEDVILWGEPGDVEVLLARGYQADVQRGGLAIARFVGCPVRFRLLPARPFDDPLVIQCGYDPQRPPTSEHVLPPGAWPPDGILEVDRCLCGSAWYRIALDRDRSRLPSQGDGFCEGTDGAGMWHTADAAPRTELTCKLAH